MNIKEKIGQRIKAERTAKELTRKALAELTETLNVSRINNYERGERTPGPEEVVQLGKALGVAASYLMCLSDDKQGKPNSPLGASVLIPVLDFKQACHPKEFMQEGRGLEHCLFVAVAPDIVGSCGKSAFALRIQDESMAPELRVNDVLIINPDIRPSPGDFVVAQLNNDAEVMVRKYKQLSVSEASPAFELVALHEDWANIQVNAAIKSSLIGVVVSLQRKIK